MIGLDVLVSPSICADRRTEISVGSGVKEIALPNRTRCSAILERFSNGRKDMPGTGLSNCSGLLFEHPP